MYDVLSGQYLNRIPGGVFSYPEFEAYPGMSFKISETTSIHVTGSVLGGTTKKIINEVRPNAFLLADTGGADSEIRKIEKYDLATGLITINKKFTLPVGNSYQLKIISDYSGSKIGKVNTTFYSDSEHPLFINGIVIPLRDKMTFLIEEDTFPFLLYSSGDYIITESAVQFNNLSHEIFSGRPGYCYMKYYNASDAAIQGSTAKKKIFDVLVGKTIDDFCVIFLGGIYVQRNDDAPAANEVQSIDTGTGEITFKNNQPVKGIYLIIVNI